MAHYLIPYFICNLFLIVWWIYLAAYDIHMLKSNSSYYETIYESVIGYLTQFFLPLQGLMNATIYFLNSPRVKQWFSDKRTDVKYLIMEKTGIGTSSGRRSHPPIIIISPLDSNDAAAPASSAASGTPRGHHTVADGRRSSAASGQYELDISSPQKPARILK